ncbi:MAG: FAD-binding oxidoreductase [Rhodospirillaceae bacterium]|jgi:glycine/D-amino acid oxidase-like deaminating enzyme|nr:FAD-binding oxidoreductase [Rhodospirillaceae bacterium]MBT6203911.1 FAD-binding oxidoreductase [Rhodospirillaceae bacterium]MBT6512565.1 FAD-binding oxidoreductase [Rhodospirillaceae bacterium]MBT7614796.1 FAD-binding oxidoreductase [Rhodospirillaceae bacterium]
MTKLFHDAMYDPSRPLDSHWEASAGNPVADCDPVDGDVTCDVAVIGGGFTGLSAALHLARDDQLSVRVIEAVAPGWGASGRNGGHCCFGGAGLDPTEIVDAFSEEVARQNITAQREAIEFVADLAISNDLDIDMQGKGELCVAHTRKAMDELRDETAMWKRLGGFDCELMETPEVHDRMYEAPNITGGMLFPFGFGLHPMKYSRELARLAQRHGAVIHGNSPVTGWARENGKHRLATPTGTVTADKVLIATNGFTRDDLHPATDGCLLPVISEIVATRPLTDEELARHRYQAEMPLYDKRPMFAYYRVLPDRRIHMGGPGGMTGTPASKERWRSHHEKRIATIWPEWRDVEIEHCWRGFVCLSSDKLTHLGEVPDDPGVFYSLAYHGNGVAMASWSGRAIAGLISGRANRAIPATMTQPLRPFALPALRKFHVYKRYGLRMARNLLGIG